MWEALSFGMKMIAMIILFTFIALAFGAGMVKMSNKKARERKRKERGQ